MTAGNVSQITAVAPFVNGCFYKLVAICLHCLLIAIKQEPAVTFRESICKSFTSILVLPFTERMLTLYSMSFNMMINLELVLRLSFFKFASCH